ncbi:MAG: peptide-methionine (S)-S-oxide reductase [Bacteroidetes bacterium]|nr:MAG: peptide-methionine (S)-S-oxide reductase [Bacteroidota bacterium]
MRVSIQSRLAVVLLLLPLCLWACKGVKNGKQAQPDPTVSRQLPAGLSKAYFASGCFWCVEAIFESVKGVEEVISGYSGGEEENPTYELVSSGRTGHAEAVEVYYDSTVVSYETLLKVFFGSHDPTTPNQQGPDRGPQYRSVIFYQNETEKQLAEAYIRQLEESGAFPAKIVTEVVPFRAFYPAEDYHQDFEKKNPNQPYVRAVSIPRLKRFQQKFPELLKEGAGH